MSAIVDRAKETRQANQRGTSTPGERLADYSERDARRDARRALTQGIAELFEQDPRRRFDKKAAAVHACTTRLWFKWTRPQATGETSLRLVNAEHCRDRSCPVCQAARSRVNVKRFLAALPSIEQEHPRHRWLMLTLTVPNPAYGALRATIKAMNAGWKRLIERKDWPAIGWVRTVEVTDEHRRSGYCHPHFHALLLVPPSYFSHGYVTQSAWLDRWQTAMRDDSIQVVDVRVIRNAAGQLTADAIRDGAAEVLKYAMKPEDALQNPEFLYTCAEQLRGLRFLAAGGVLKHALKEDPDNKEMVKADDAPGEVDQDSKPLAFDWNTRKRHYYRNRTKENAS